MFGWFCKKPKVHPQAPAETGYALDKHWTYYKGLAENQDSRATAYRGEPERPAYEARRAYNDYRPPTTAGRDARYWHPDDPEPDSYQMNREHGRGSANAYPQDFESFREFVVKRKGWMMSLPNDPRNAWSWAKAIEARNQLFPNLVRNDGTLVTGLEPSQLAYWLLDRNYRRGMTEVDQLRRFYTQDIFGPCNSYRGSLDHIFLRGAYDPQAVRERSGESLLSINYKSWALYEVCRSIQQFNPSIKEILERISEARRGWTD